jgi:hypothetical protein
MSQINWHENLGKIRPYIFKITTPGGSGTGFLIFSNRKGLCGVATAYHVIAHAYEWDETIKLTHQESGKVTTLKAVTNRPIIVYPDKDLAFIIFSKSDLPLQDGIPGLIESRQILNQGVPIGWCGFPVLAPNDLCFFSGSISCYLSIEGSYLVDGVAIHGVSGSPAFYIDEKTGDPKICGVISDYFPNRSTGQSLPGLSKIRSVEPYQATLSGLKSIDEAAEKAQEQQVKVSVETSSPKVDAGNSAPKESNG